MANDKTFQDKDEELTWDFMKDRVDQFAGKRVLDICGGIGRNGELLKHHFTKIDILDLEPSFELVPIEKQGKLI